MKKCKSCQQEIDAKATKCPHCQADQRNWFSKHKVITAIIAIFVILVIIGVASNSKSSTSSGSKSSTSNSNTSSSKSQQTTATIGQTANDGKFQFTVTSFKCGQATVGQDYLTKTAQGQYCLLNLSVKNIGSQAQMLDASNQYLYDSSNNKLSADSTASMYANPSGSTFLNDINPGNTVTGTVVFDVAKDATVVSAELHDSALSGGIKVNLK